MAVLTDETSTPKSAGTPPHGPGVLRVAGGVVVIAALLVLAIFVWPTRYRHDTMRFGSRSLPVRIDRFTGAAEMLQPDGWHAMERSDEYSLAEAALSSSELGRLAGTARIESHGWVTAEIYNGNSFPVGSIVASITIKDADGNVVLSRHYRLSSTGGSPQQNSEYVADLGFRLQPSQSFEWQIKSASRR